MGQNFSGQLYKSSGMAGPAIPLLYQTRGIMSISMVNFPLSTADWRRNHNSVVGQARRCFVMRF